MDRPPLRLLLLRQLLLLFMLQDEIIPVSHSRRLLSSIPNSASLRVSHLPPLANHSVGLDPAGMLPLSLQPLVPLLSALFQLLASVTVATAAVTCGCCSCCCWHLLLPLP